MKSLTSFAKLFRRSGAIIRTNQKPNSVAKQVNELLINNSDLINQRYLIINHDYDYIVKTPRYLILERLWHTNISLDLSVSSNTRHVVSTLDRNNIYCKLILTNFTNIIEYPTYVEDLFTLRHNCILIDTKDNVDQYLYMNNKSVNLKVIDI